MRKRKSKLPTQKKRYILYARKSTTSEDRQVASIESQIEVMEEVAREHELNIVKVMSEASSGYHPGRKVFNEMIEMIKRGEADGIVAWKLSRLSRNPDDAGTIMGMVQRAEIKHIRTVDRNWFPEDNVMMMYVEFGINNQYSKDLSKDTVRGLVKKAERGWFPIATLPLGYKHIQYKRLGEDEIIADEDSFYLVQKGLKLVASKQMTPVEAMDHLVGLGLNGKRGKPLAPSTWYSILDHPLYAGTFEYPAESGNIYESKAVKAITPEEYDAIQVVLGKKTKPRPKKHFLPYTGLMICGECGCSITAEKKKKVQKNGNVHRYIYYRCTKKKGACSQSAIRVEDLESQFVDLLGSLKVPQAFHDWALEEIKHDQEKQIEDRSFSLERARKSYDACLKELDNLVEKYLEGKVPEDYYQRNLAKLEQEKATKKKVLDAIDERVDERLEELDQDLGFAVTASQSFADGDDYERREIISNLGSNLLLADKTLDIDLREPLEIVQKMAKDVQVAAERFAPLENVDNSAHFRSYLSKNPVMGGIPDSNRRPSPPQGDALTNWANTTKCSRLYQQRYKCAQQDSNLRPTA